MYPLNTIPNLYQICISGATFILQKSIFSLSKKVVLASKSHLLNKGQLYNNKLFDFN